MFAHALCLFRLRQSVASAKTTCGQVHRVCQGHVHRIQVSNFPPLHCHAHGSDTRRKSHQSASIRIVSEGELSPRNSGRECPHGLHPHQYVSIRFLSAGHHPRGIQVAKLKGFYNDKEETIDFVLGVSRLLGPLHTATEIAQQREDKRKKMFASGFFPRGIMPAQFQGFDIESTETTRSALGDETAISPLLVPLETATAIPQLREAKSNNVFSSGFFPRGIIPAEFRFPLIPSLTYLKGFDNDETIELIIQGSLGLSGHTGPGPAYFLRTHAWPQYRELSGRVVAKHGLELRPGIIPLGFSWPILLHDGRHPSNGAAWFELRWGIIPMGFTPGGQPSSTTDAIRQTLQPGSSCGGELSPWDSGQVANQTSSTTDAIRQTVQTGSSCGGELSPWDSARWPTISPSTTTTTSVINQAATYADQQTSSTTDAIVKRCRLVRAAAGNYPHGMQVAKRWLPADDSQRANGRTPGLETEESTDGRGHRLCLDYMLARRA
ncbi:hypothetical protein FN846DRAFT_886160 [Sphaerosporella brunnea]|uniref:Uncharacterized protein n=1 Tax=Sphaerosporella brunnea TaxID=1250544 RepID=A0A5J5FAM2_9PEZI|nr:hypothetical protein FN846DRAFT_886160 [Sphaerosporella brunnea]